VLVAQVLAWLKSVLVSQVLAWLKSVLVSQVLAGVCCSKVCARC